MTYNSLDHGINNDQISQGAIDLRLACGNLLPEDYTDAQLEERIKSAYSTIQGAVHRALDDPFVEDQDVWFGHAKQLELLIAQMRTLKAYGPEFQDKVSELRTETNEDLQLMQVALGIITEGEGTTIEEPYEDGTIESTDLGAWCVNGSQVMIPNRMKGCKSDSKSGIEGLGPVRLDPNSDFT